jgi:hypothetical protein
MINPVFLCLQQPEAENDRPTRYGQSDCIEDQALNFAACRTLNLSKSNFDRWLRDTRNLKTIEKLLCRQEFFF